MKTVKGDEIIEHIREFQVKGCESWVDLVKYIMQQLKGKILIDETELRAICKNCNHQPTKDFYSCHTCHEINPKEILKDEV